MNLPPIGPPPIVLRADARDLPLADNSVDLVVTSPPYFGLRSYTDGGQHYAEQIGAEATPAEFVDALIDVTRECMRVLKPSGSLWVNLGDRYAGGDGQWEKDERPDPHKRRAASGSVGTGGKTYGLRPKSLIGVPWRYALRCIDDIGLILRAEVIWSKCLSGGTRVYAEAKGRPTAIRLHDLCRAYQPEDVRLWTGTQWSQVRAWEATGRSEAQYEIELRSGERIGATAEHRWPTSRGLLRSDQLAIGDVLDTAPLPDGTTHPEALDDEMVGWFVGLYIAEGSRSEQTIQIAGHVKEDERYRRLCEIAQAFHGTCKVYATGGNTATVNLTGPMLRAILEIYVGGRTAKDKHLQPKCWQRSNRFLRAVLDGYLSGDGGWDENLRRWTLGFTANDALAEDLRALAARLGLSLRLNRTTHYGFGKQWPGWGGTLYDDPSRRRAPDSQIVAIRPSRARQFWDIEIEDEPHLFALASGVLTHNSNGLPESVTDRVRRSHEQWFHFTQEPRYFSAVDEVREEYAPETAARYAYSFRPAAAVAAGQSKNGPTRADGGGPGGTNPLGKLPGSVWTVPTEPLRVPEHLGVDHFAAFASEFPRRIILGWSPRGVCVECGEGRRSVVETVRVGVTQRRDATTQLRGGGSGGGYALPGADTWRRTNATITGYVCACPEPTAPTTPAVILDPFGGTGTTAHVAHALGRQGISVDLSNDYCRIARDPDVCGQRVAKVRGIKREKRVEVTGQDDLFGEVVA